MISVTILAKNSQQYLKEVLEALRAFDEVIVYDTGSSDDTIEIARTFRNVKLYSEPFIGFGATHNQASSKAKHDWILSIDSDEIITTEMAKDILSLKLDLDCVYSFPRHNYFNGKLIKWCGWYPDRQIRLYNRKVTEFSDNLLHEVIITEGRKHIKLNSPIHHYSYSSISELLHKLQLYTDLFAKQNQGRIPSSPFNAISQGVYSFFNCYILKRGFLGGYEGYVISRYNAHTAYYNYLKLYEANCKLLKVKGAGPLDSLD